MILNTPLTMHWNLFNQIISVIMSFCFQIDTEQLLAHLVETEMIKRTVSSIATTVLCFSSLNLSILIGDVWFFRKKEHTRDGSSVRSVISSDIRLEDLYHQILTATMLMWVLYLCILENWMSWSADPYGNILITLNNLGSWTHLPAYDCSWTDWVHGNCV